MAFMTQIIFILNIEWSTNDHYTKTKNKPNISENIPKLSRWWLRKQKSLINILNFQNAFVIVVQSLSCVWLFATPWNATYSLSFTISRILLKLMFIESVMPSDHLILCHLLLLLPSISPSIKVCSTESILHIRWPKYWFFSFSINPANEYSAWFPLGLTGLISLLSMGLSRVQERSLKASILQCAAFFIVQLSHLYRINGKTIALTIWTFVGKVMSLLFNTLSRLVIAFLPRSKSL